MLTMFKVIQLIFFLFVTQSFGRSNFFEEFDERQGMLSAKELEREFDERQGMPSAKELEREFDERQGISSAKELDEVRCIKDIFIIVDASNSINNINFDNHLVPFLILLIGDARLNVAPDGTHISILSFSSEERTNMTYGIKFANRTKEELVKLIIAKMVFSRLSGERTYTGKALGIANKTLGVGNVREGVEQVVIIVTDGKPNDGTDENKEKDKALAMAAELKKRGILVIVIALGDNSKIEEFKEILEQLSTNGTVLITDFKDINSIIAKLVDASCFIKPGDCWCVGNIGRGDVYAKPGEMVKVSWKKPSLECKKNRKLTDVTTKADPNIKSPHSFGIGPHTISYIFEGKAAGKTIKTEPCTVEFNVKPCGCEATSTVVATIPPGQSKVSVDWIIPKPKKLCPATLTSISPENVVPGHSFSYGDSTVSYVYEAPVGLVTCTVHIKVKGELCGGKSFLPTSQECCCGKVYVKKAGHACCGMFYHDQSATSCCKKNSNVVGRYASCPGE